MRKFMLLAVASLAAVLGVSGIANAINGTQELKIKLGASKAGTKTKPRSVSYLTVTTTTTPAADDPAFATKQAIIYFDKNLVFNSPSFKNCTDTKPGTIDTSCSGAKVGTGSAKGVALGQTENLSVKAYNGLKGKALYLHVTGDTPLKIDAVMNGKLASATGQFAKKLIVTIPDNLQQPAPGVFATLTSFITKTSGTQKGKPYIGLKGCPTSKKLKFRGTFSYTDGTSKTADATAPCSK
jgi:hypothetical protein